jgi:hypothetical protein
VLCNFGEFIFGVLVNNYQLVMLFLSEGLFKLCPFLSGAARLTGNSRAGMVLPSDFEGTAVCTHLSLSVSLSLSLSL